jgi:co-chaperonin GroES (HSP10)
MQFELKPMNKYLVIDPLKEDERVGREGILVAPGNRLDKQHRMARIVAKDECDEAKHLSVGDMVFYDHIGAVEGRVGMQGFTIIKAIAVLALVEQKES